MLFPNEILVTKAGGGGLFSLVLAFNKVNCCDLHIEVIGTLVAECKSVNRLSYSVYPLYREQTDNLEGGSLQTKDKQIWGVDNRSKNC